MLMCLGGHPAERHPPCHGHPGAHEDPAGPGETHLGEGTNPKPGQRVSDQHHLECVSCILRPKLMKCCFYIAK